ncbi:MAG TPA: sigma-70 family RNA polymerase sigma factor [Verrucomicrobiae bacterium]|nr:sigma-70 family RNA polymerase sigma factor [Verrucomicrobiae bacterium]
MEPDKDELIATRTTLLERLKNWDDDPSWREFFETYWKLIYGFAIRNGLNAAEAQDVVQETMFSVARNISSFEYDKNLGSFKHWLMNMTRWRIQDQMRRRGKFPEAIQADGAETQTQFINKIPDPASLNAQRLWDIEWEKNLLDTAVSNVKRRLDPEKYQIFDFLVNKAWPAEKVAKAFGLSIEQIYSAKHRVTELLKSEVQRIERENM